MEIDTDLEATAEMLYNDTLKEHHKPGDVITPATLKAYAQAIIDELGIGYKPIKVVMALASCGYIERHRSEYMMR